MTVCGRTVLFVHTNALSNVFPGNNNLDIEVNGAFRFLSYELECHGLSLLCFVEFCLVSPAFLDQSFYQVAFSNALSSLVAFKFPFYFVINFHLLF